MTFDELGLEEDCPKCEGKTQYKSEDYHGSPRMVMCEECNATGKVPSAEGNKLIEFLAKHLVAKFQPQPSWWGPKQ